MAINTLSKNSISIIVALLLVIILSESKLFFFFTETYLGRAILILVLLFASHINKILGIVCVFIIIIMFNSNTLFFNYEGFETNATGMTNTGDKTNSNDKIQNIKNKIAETESTSDNVSQDQTTTNSPTTSTPSAVATDSTTPSKINVVTSSLNKSGDSNSGIEGFDLQSTENTIKRGKQSNTIPVTPYLNTSVEVAPYEGNIHANSFNEGFSIF
jgi:hypothetical protein